MFSRGGLDNSGFNLLLALFVMAAVWVYFAWCRYHYVRVDSHEALDGEEVLVETRRHQIAVFPGFISGGIGLCFVLWGLGLWANGGEVHFTLRKHNHFEKSARWHRLHHEPEYIKQHIGFSVWWLPFLIGLLLVLYGLYVWQDWKHTKLLATTKRWIEQRTASYYMPWLTPYFNPLPFEQVADTDDEASKIGNIGNWWGTVVIIRKLMEASDKELPREYYRMVPNYVHIADTLRKAWQQFKEDLKETEQGDEQSRQIARIADSLEALLLRNSSTGDNDDTRKFPPVT
jgi:hypothetical protein